MNAISNGITGNLGEKMIVIPVEDWKEHFNHFVYNLLYAPLGYS
jgi:hypothetical protein